MGQRQPRHRRHHRALEARAHLGRIEHQRLDQLGGEQRHGGGRQRRHRHVDIAGQRPHQQRPDQRHQRDDHAQPVRNPGQPTRQEVIALVQRQGRTADENLAHMTLHDLHGAIDPAVALRHEGFQRVGHQARTHALRNIGRLVTGLEQLETQLGVFGNAPFAPAIDFLQRVLAHDGHGAVLDDGIVLVALDHADMEEAAILLIGHGLETVLSRIAVILRPLHQRDGR